MTYKNTSTGELFTLEEVKELYEQFKWEMKLHFDSFDEYLDHLLKTGGLEELEDVRMMYAILDVPYNYDLENEDYDHRIFASFDAEEITAELIRIGADDEHYSVEIYRVDEDGEFFDGSDYDTPSNFIRRAQVEKSRIYNTCLAEALNYSDQDAFVSDLALSSIWGDDAEEIPEGRIEWLRQIWTAARRSVKDICKDAGLTQRGLAEFFNIPARTIGNWCTGERACPEYTRIMMQEILGLVHR